MFHLNLSSIRLIQNGLQLLNTIGFPGNSSRRNTYCRSWHGIPMGGRDRKRIHSKTTLRLYTYSHRKHAPRPDIT